jgi:hypothetical protein
MKKLIRRIVILAVIGFLISRCHILSDSRTDLTINLDKSFSHQLKLVWGTLGTDTFDAMEQLKPGDSYSIWLFPDDSGSHLHFCFDIGRLRYYWASNRSDLFKKSFAHKYFRPHHRYKIIIDIKPDLNLYIKVYLKRGLFSKKLMLQGEDKMQSNERIDS